MLGGTPNVGRTLIVTPESHAPRFRWSQSATRPVIFDFYGFLVIPSVAEAERHRLKPSLLSMLEPRPLSEDDPARLGGGGPRARDRLDSAPWSSSRSVS